MLFPLQNMLEIAPLLSTQFNDHSYTYASRMCVGTCTWGLAVQHGHIGHMSCAGQHGHRSHELCSTGVTRTDTKHQIKTKGGWLLLKNATKAQK